MKIGFNMFLWTGHVTKEHAPLFMKLKEAGYDGVQVPVLEGDEKHFAEIGKLLTDIGLESQSLTILGTPEQHLVSENSSYRKNGVDHLKWAVDCNVAMGSKMLCGPMYQTLGHFTGNGPTEDELKWAADAFRELGDYAGAADVQVVIETVNRFESYLVNTMADLCSLIESIDHPAVTGMYDTFHANIEEKDMFECIRSSASHIGYVHISENDRGTPGRGHIEFNKVFSTLKSIDYDGWLTIEAFGRALPQLAAATRVWRDFFPSTDQVWQEGIEMIRTGWEG